MHPNKPAISDQILDLLLDALQERQAQKVDSESTPSTPNIVTPNSSLEDTIFEEPAEYKIEPHRWALNPLLTHEEETAVSPTPKPAIPEPPTLAVEDATRLDALFGAEDALPAATEFEEDETAVPTPPPFINLEHTLGRIIFALILLVVIVNIPFNQYGTNLARAMPDSAALIIRDGLLLTASDEKVYVLEDNRLRWIATLDAFEWYGYRWENVHQVDDDYLTQFDFGEPLHLLVKCDGSPHVFGLENGEKRWIKDIATFTDLGYEWEQIQTVGCSLIDRLPLGTPIPADAGTPPD